MDSKSIFLSKTFYLNLLGPLFLWLGSKYGLQVDADTQATIVTGGLAVANIIMRLITKGPAHILPPAAAILIAITLAGALSACTSAEVATTTAALQSACAEAKISAATAQSQLKGGALNTANGIAVYVAAACASEQAMAAIANDPSTLAWLGQLKGQLDATVAAQRKA